MGLDVDLIQFTDLDTEAILKFARASREPGALNCKAIARALGLPENIVGSNFYSGTQISYASEKHGAWPLVGEWTSFRSTRELIEFFTGKDFYFVFPEAIGDPEYLRPNWAASRKKLHDILEQIRHLKPAQMEHYRQQFILPEIPPQYLEKVPSSMQATSAQLLGNHIAQIEVIIETLDHVLNHKKPHEFLLRWSA
jgi:hypothetical protein